MKFNLIYISHIIIIFMIIRDYVLFRYTSIKFINCCMIELQSMSYVLCVCLVHLIGSLFNTMGSVYIVLGLPRLPTYTWFAVVSHHGLVRLYL